MYYVTIEKMAHGLIRRYSPTFDAETAQQRLCEAAEDWLKRGYTILCNSIEQAVILDQLEGMTPIAILQIATIGE